jgi:hypothetical protein
MNEKNQINSNYQKMFALIGLVIIFPMTWFFIHVFLKYFLGINSFFDVIDSVFQIKPLEILITLSPLAALMLNAFSLIKINFKTESKYLLGNLSLKLQPLNLIVCVLSICYLSVIVAYGFTENFCYCHN